MWKLYQEDIIDVQKEKTPVFYKLKCDNFKDLSVIIEENITKIYITETGFHYLTVKINMHICILLITFFFYFSEVGALDKLPTPEEMNQS